VKDGDVVQAGELVRQADVHASAQQSKTVAAL
jgi:hypothetical protein